MDEDDNGSENRQKKKEDLYVLKEDKFKGKSYLEKYHYYDNLKVNNETEEYFRLCQKIYNGKYLLPSKPDPEDIEKINNLYNETCSVYENAVTNSVTKDYGWIDPSSKNFPSQQLIADDGGSHSFPPDQCEKAWDDFRENQHSFHISKLRKVDDQQGYFFAKYKIISKLPSPTDTLKEQLAEEFQSNETELK